jgi:hypothetical protein
VTVASDGTITVENESGAQEGAEEGAGGAENESSGAQPVTVKSGDEAGELVKHLIAQATGGQTSQQNIAQQSAGYSGS